MPRLNIFGLGQESKSPYVTAKSLQNMYCETRPNGEKSSMVAYRTPGLELFNDFGSSVIRGMWEFQKTSLAFLVVGNTFYEVNGSGVFTSRGTLNTSTGFVSMSDNGTQVMIVDGTDGYIYNTSTNVFVTITDPDFPNRPQTVAFLAGRFVVNIENSNTFYWSDLYDGLAWDALSFSSAESSADPIVAIWTCNGQLFLFGTKSMEPWGVSGSADQPYLPIQGAASEWGLGAQWSVAKCDNSVAMLIRNRMGQVMVAKMSGYLPEKISTPDIDAEINSYEVTSDATAYSYMLNGHPMYVISFPNAGYTWLYDGLTGIWSKLKSYGITRHRTSIGISFLVYTLAADYADGRLYKIMDTAYTDDGDPIESLIVSQTITTPDLDRFSVSKLRLDMEVGQGDVSCPNPQVGLTISRDNGKTWGNEMMRNIGPIGTYSNVIDFTRLGVARNNVYKLRVTDPFDFTIVNAFLNPED